MIKRMKGRCWLLLTIDYDRAWNERSLSVDALEGELRRDASGAEVDAAYARHGAVAVS